ncbi:hypothetical protein PC122_g18355 [Phytophthora cactorum]|nr:hypothetical protein PC122_g18355 [Phytophthora cactorum]
MGDVVPLTCICVAELAAALPRKRHEWLPDMASLVGKRSSPRRDADATFRVMRQITAVATASMLKEVATESGDADVTICASTAGRPPQRAHGCETMLKNLLQDVDASSETETASAGEANDVTVNTYASHGSEIAATDNSMALIASIKTSASSTNTKLPVLVQRPALLPLLAAQQRLTPLLPTPHQRQRLVPP